MLSSLLGSYKLALRPVAGQTGGMTSSLRPDLVVDQLLHPNERDRFVSLCSATTCDELAEQLPRIATYAEEIETAAKTNELTDVETGHRIAAVLTDLVKTDCAEPSLTDEGRALLRGAVEYFLLTGDTQDDLTDLLGFDDDVRVVNAVSGVLDRDDLHINFD